jgi:hypothetical protein
MAVEARGGTAFAGDIAFAGHALRLPWFVVVAVGLCVLAFGRDNFPVGVSSGRSGALVMFFESREPSGPSDQHAPRRRDIDVRRVPRGTPLQGWAL